ncbi:MAG: cytochrome P450 [Pseudomonadota bacterium]
MTGAIDIAGFDLSALPPGFVDDPYPLYRALRETDPVKEMPDGSYFLTRYDDLIAIYRDTTLFSSDKKVEFKPKYGDTPLFTHHTTSLVFNDPPLHTFVRKIIVRALTPRAIAAMEGGLIQLVDRLLDAMAEKGYADLIEDYAAAIPIDVIGNLLDVPVEDRGPLRGWSLAILGALEPKLSQAQLDLGNRAVTDFSAYLDDLIKERRKRPGDPAKDVLTRLIQGQDGETLSSTELIQNCIFILNAGHETTTNLIGNGLFALQTHPGERTRLIENPDLIDSAVEEVLRFESSNQLGNRMTTGPVTIGGRDLPAGARLTLCIGAANRDPAQFRDPERFDIARSPNKHLAFASGPHTCAGLSLARLEGKIALSRFLNRFPDYEIKPTFKRSPRVRFRGFLSLPAKL